MHKKTLTLFLAALALLLCASAARAEVEWLATGPDGETQIVLWYFYSDTCPHCLEAKPFIASLISSSPRHTVPAAS